MKIKQLFKKDIAREIKGVIKVGQEAENDVRQELDEYVVTDELQAHFVYFFKQYLKSLNVPTDQMGVWISGFFGSGKSHFLKILSYLLDSNLEVDGKKAVEFFREKIQDQALLDQMQQVADAPSDIILFNTPSKSEDDNGDSKLSIVKVFNKVFNEKLGYSASIPWVAQMEEILDQNGQYKSFKQVFQAKSELAWEDAREEIYYNEDMIVETLVEVANMSEESARRWIDNGEESYEISVDSFAKRIKKYVDKQPADYHLVFLADEMGQFVSDDVHRMLDLQTIVEDLGKYTLGKVWVIVTSQQDIDELEKDIHSSQDFSKIQGRFNTRLSLSSANADEVIKKRLLEKNDSGKDAVQLLYTSEVKASLRNKINFSDGTISLK
ncbi:MAG: BREX system P-loop protein BrxC, partial [Trichococcus flocculiformis]